jgi:hypothetical protein
MRLPGLPPRRLLGERARHRAPVVERVERQRLLHRGEARLVREQIAHGQLRLARLRKLGPVAGDGRVEIDETLVDEPVQRERGEALGRRVDIHERVALEGPRALGIAMTGPEIDDELALECRRDSGAELVPGCELALERVAHPRERGMTRAVDLDRRCHYRNPSARSAASESKSSKRISRGACRPRAPSA